MSAGPISGLNGPAWGLSQRGIRKSTLLTPERGCSATRIRGGPLDRRELVPRGYACLGGPSAAGAGGRGLDAGGSAADRDSSVGISGERRDQPALTLIATVTSIVDTSTALWGSVTFEDAGAPIEGCASMAVTPNGQSATVACTTSFAASTASLTAVFSPTGGSILMGSASPADTRSRSDPTRPRPCSTRPLR